MGQNDDIQQLWSDFALRIFHVSQTAKLIDTRLQKVSCFLSLHLTEQH